MLTLADILEALTGVRLAEARQELPQIVIDSRQALPGALFVALQGEKTDGHDYLEHAFKRGAVAALVQREPGAGRQTLDLRRSWEAGPLAVAWQQLDPKAPICLHVENSLAALQQAARFWRRRRTVRVIGITGSVGKSTTKELAAQVLEQRFRTLKNVGNLNNEIGLPLTLLHLTEEHERAVLEMGFYVPGEIAFLCELAQPQVGVITIIGTVHAERAGSQEAIARGKGELVEALPPDGVAILNYDDPWVREMAARTRAHVFYYGLDPSADLWADRLEGLGLEGIRFRLHYRKEVIYLKVPLIGRHSVHTALRAAAIGLVEGLTWQEIVSGLRGGRAQLRLVSVRGKNGSLILDDTYNASPESTLAALNLLDELDGHKIAILGDMLELGPYERSGHSMVGVRAAEVADELVAVGKLAALIAEAAMSAGMPVANITRLASTDAAITFMKDRLGASDIVLIKGSRGMQMDRLVAALEDR